ncbi:hypothetical protein KFL_000580260 [Klebsormidium nitens]|uniref:Sfi1 spindle body domain-containing protein n=1 Tax=Klebsormidium nitens TaxID=105231 RepID=A0A1Y1HS41_KLENI|nr:hypothetical protein KFL_000580260 [Klebsormidium nitens]|eukprot:GAQ80632.1 hypothetical protein KFL_000580260 [Klebsormidium nitens]
MDYTIYDAYQSLPGVEEPYSKEDMTIIAEIIQVAEKKAALDSSAMSLMLVLQAYEEVLQRHGMDPREDTFFYRCLLKLSLYSSPDWWARFKAECARNEGQSKALAFHRRHLLSKAWLHWRWGPRDQPSSSTPHHQVQLIPQKLPKKQPPPTKSKPSGGVQIDVSLLEGVRPGLDVTPLAAEDEAAFERFRWLAICFRIWRCNTEILKILRKETAAAEMNWERAAAHWKAALMRSVFLGWNSFGAAKESVGREHRLGRVLAAWRGRIRRIKEAEEESALHYNWTLVSAAFRIWGPKGKAAADRHVALLRRRAELTKARCLRKWGEWVVGHVWKREVVQGCLESAAARNAGKILGVWAAWAGGKRDRRRRGREAEGRIWARKGQLVIRAWITWAAERHRKSALTERGHLHRMTKALHTSLHTWRKRAVRSRRLHALTLSAERILTLKSLDRIMRSWLGVKRRRVAHEQLLADCKRAASHLAATKVWTKWREVFLTKTLVNPHRLRANLRLTRRVFWALKENAQYSLAKKESIHTAGRWWRQQRVRMSLRGWRSYTEYRQGKAGLEVRVVKMRRAHTLRGAFRQWEDAVDHRQEQKAVCCRALLHWRNRGLARAFNTWHAIVEAKSQRTATMIKAVGRWEVFDLASAFATWREETASTREKKALAAACVERWRLWRVWAAWEVWREVVERRHEDKAVMRRVLTNWQNLPIARAFRRWTEHTAEALYQRSLLRKALGRLANLTLSKAFATLKANADAVKRRRGIVERARHTWALRWKKAFLSELRSAVVAGKQRRIVVKFFGGQLCARAFQGWREARERALGGRARAEKLAHERDSYVRDRAFLRWHACARANREKRASLTCHVAARERAKLGRCFAEWRTLVGYRAWKGEMLQKAERFDGRRVCHVALQEWKAWHRIKTSKSWALGLWSEGLLKSAFRRWRAHTRRAKTLAQTFQTGLQTRQTRLVSRAFVWWKLHARFRRHLGAASEVAAGRGDRALLRWALARWARATKMVHVAVKQWRQSWLQKGLQGLLSHAQKERRLRTAAQVAIARWASGEVSLALAGGALASGKASRIALEVWRRKSLLRCLTAWQTWLRNAKWKERANALAELGNAKWKERANALAERCCGNGYKDKALRAWKEYFEQRARGYEAKERADSVWRERETARVMHAWREHAGTAPVLRRALAHWQKGQLSGAFGLWRELARARTDKRGRLERAVAFWNTHRLRAAFLGWHDGWESRREKKRALRRAVGFWRSMQLRGAFSCWLDGFLYRKDVRTRVEQALLRHGKRMASAVLRNWAAVVSGRGERERLVERALVRRGVRVSREVLRFWRGWAEEHARWGALLEGARARRALKQMAEVLAEWSVTAREKRRARKVLTAVVKSWQQRTLRSAFDGWADKVADKRRRLGLLNRAVVLLTQRQLYTAFHQWREVTEAEQTARAVEDMAVEHDCARLLRKALASWIDRMETIFRVNLLREKRGRRLLAAALEGFRYAAGMRQVKREARRLYDRKMAAEAWAAWREYVKCVREIVSAADQLAVRVKAQYRRDLLAGAFFELRENVRVKRALRALLRNWQVGALGRAFRTWVRLIWTRKAAAALYERVRTERLREILRDWLDTAKNIRKEEAEVARIAALCHGKPLGERALRALARWECLKQALAFDRWLEWCHERELARAHTTRALESRYRRLLTSAVAGFRLAVERGRRRRWGEGMRERNAKKLHFRSWTSYCALQREKRARAHLAAGHWMRTLLHAWKRRVRALRAAREANARALLAYARRLKQSGWVSWRQLITERRARLEFFTLVFIRMENFRLRTVLLRWKGIADMKKAVAATVVVFRAARAQAAARCQVRAWHAHAHRQRFLRRAVRGFQRAHVLGGAFLNWARTARAQKAKRRAINVAHRHWLARCAGPAFARWREVALQVRDARAAVRRGGRAAPDVTMAELKALLATWRNSTYQRIHRVAVVDAVVYRARLRLQAGALASWVEHTAEAHRWKAVLERALRAWAYNRAHAALQGWREGVREQKRLRDTVTKAGLRWRNVQLAGAFDGFRSRVATLGDQRAAAAYALAAFQNPVARAVFNSWVDVAATSAHHRAVVERMTILSERRARAAAFREWSVFTQGARRLKRKTLLALQLHRTIWRDEAAAECAVRSSLIRSLRAWSRWHSKCAAVKRLQRVRAHQLCRDPFLAWKEVVSHKKHLLALEKELAASNLRRHVAQCYADWKHAATAMRHHRVGILRRTLLAWRARHAEKAYWRARAADVASVITSTRVQRMMWAWQQLAHEMAVTREEHHRRQLALREAYVVAEKSARRRQMALCHAVFATWRAHKERSARVAAFSARRLRQSKAATWQLWRQVIAQQKETEGAARAFAAANQLWRSMQRWKGFMALCEERRGALARCWAMLDAGEQRTRAVAAVKGWRDRTIERKRKRAAHARAGRHRGTRLVTDHFQAWAAYTAAVEDTSHRLRTAVECYTSDPGEDDASAAAAATTPTLQTPRRRGWSFSSPAGRKPRSLGPTRHASFSPQSVGSPEYAVRRTSARRIRVGDPFGGERPLSPPRNLYSPPRVRPVPAPEKLPSPAEWRAFSNPLAHEQNDVGSGSVPGGVHQRNEGKKFVDDVASGIGTGRVTPASVGATGSSRAQTGTSRSPSVARSEPPRTRAGESFHSKRPQSVAGARLLGFEGARQSPAAARRQRARWSTPAAVLLPSFDSVADNELFSEESNTSLADPETIFL